MKKAKRFLSLLLVVVLLVSMIPSSALAEGGEPEQEAAETILEEIIPETPQEAGNSDSAPDEAPAETPEQEIREVVSEIIQEPEASAEDADSILSEVPAEETDEAAAPTLGLKEESADTPAPELIEELTGDSGNTPSEEPETPEPAQEIMQSALSLRNLAPLQTETERAFTLQPTDAVYDLDTFKAPVSWVTNFTPTRVEMVSEAKDETIVIPVSSQNGSYDIPYRYRGYFWRIRAYYGMAGSQDYVESDPFEAKMNGSLTFTTAPKTDYFDSSTHEYFIEWETDFTPCRVELWWIETPEGGFFPEPVKCLKTVETGLGRSMTLGIENADFEKEYMVRVYYGDEYVEEQMIKGYFTPDGSMLRFGLQPEDGSIDPETRKFTLTWSTTFIPKKVVVYTGNILDGYERVDTITSNLSYVKRSYSFLPKVGETYFLRAYYSDTVYRESRRFTATTDGLQFTVQPGDTVLDRLRDDSSQVSWTTNFLPVKIVILDTQLDENFKLNDIIYYSSSKNLQKEMSVNVKLEVGQSRIRAYYGSGDMDYITSRRFSIADPGYLFTEKPPRQVVLDPETDYYKVHWDCNFNPTKTKVLLVDGYEEQEMSQDQILRNVVHLKNLESRKVYKYRIEAYYEKYGMEYRTTYEFTVCRAAFTEQPQDGKWSPPSSEGGSAAGADISWKTNFTPVKQTFNYVYSYGNVKVESVDLEPEQTSVSFVPEPFPDTDSYRILSWYGEGEMDCVASEVFTVIGNSFTTQPVSGFAQHGRNDDGDNVVAYEVTWATNFDPTEVEIYSVDNKGDRDGVSSCILSSPALTSYSIPFADTDDDIRTFRIRALADGEVVLSNPFTVTRPAINYDKGPFFLNEGQSATVNLYTSFVPDKVEVRLRTIQEDGTSIGSEDGELIETFYPTARTFDYTWRYEDVKDRDNTGKGYQFWCFYHDDQVSSRIGNAYLIQVATEPKFISVTESVVISPTDYDARLEARLNFVPTSFEVVRRLQGDDSSTWESLETVEGGTDTIEYPLERTGRWEHYKYVIRAFLPDDLVEAWGSGVVESEPIDVQFKGWTVSFELNGGSDAFDVPWKNHGVGYPETYPMEPVQVDDGETFTMPRCTIIPPDWMMFDHWEFRAAESGSSLPAVDTTGDGLEVTCDLIAKPIWTRRTFNTEYQLGDQVHGKDDPHYFYLNNFLTPFYPSDMVPWDAGGNKDPYERNIYVKWYHVVDGVRGEETDESDIFIDSLTSLNGAIIVRCLGPESVGDYQMVITYKGTEVVTQSFSITENAGVQGVHSYKLNVKLDKEYDGNPVEFDPDDGKAFLIDDGKTEWAYLEKMGEARYVWRQFDGKGYMDLKEAPSEPGQYQLVIQELEVNEKEKKEIWNDAAVFEFEITEGKPLSVTLYAVTDCKGSSVGDIQVTPAQKEYSVGDEVTLTAPAAAGYSFNGWYQDGQMVCSSLVYTFTITENTSLTASYTASGSAIVTINAVNGAQYTVGSSATVQSGSTENVPVGSTLTLTAVDADKVLQWQNESSKVLGRGASLSITVTGNMSITLVYKAETTNQSYVQFVSDYGQVLSAKMYSNADTIVLPDSPTKFGYTFTGWVFDGTTDEATAETIKAKLGAEPTITVKPRYTKDETYGSVTVNYRTEDGEIAEQTVISNIPTGNTRTLTAKDVDGYSFACWKNAEGTVLGYDKSYTVKITGDQTLVAYYVADGGEVETAKPIITIEEPFTVAFGSTHKVSGKVNRTIPDGYTLIEHGVLYARDVAGLNETTFVYGTDGVGRYISNATTPNGVVTLNVKVASDDVIVSLRGYMLLKNNDTGNQEYFYTDIRSGSYSSIINS